MPKDIAGKCLICDNPGTEKFGNFLLCKGHFARVMRQKELEERNNAQSPEQG